MAASDPKTSAATEAAEQELIITRLFDAPRELVFQCWTQAEHLQHWQGAPRGFTVTTQESDIRPGGSFRICMRSPEGVDSWLQGAYREIVPPERLVFTHVWLDAKGKPGKETLVTVTLAERDGKTELTLRQSGFASVESRDGHKYGWTSALDVLTDYLSEAARAIVITRVFDAPRELVFAAWTDAKHVGLWWGPRGFTTTTYEIDIRPGGVWRFMMHGPDGVDYPNKITYHEIVKPERLVYDHGDEGDPAYFHVTVTFGEQGGKTKLTMRSLFKSAEDLDMLVKKHNVIEGANQHLDKLGEQLGKMQELVTTRVLDTSREVIR
jgi:uncharacterized protein YndB with AHSA1/START domain